MVFVTSQLTSSLFYLLSRASIHSQELRVFGESTEVYYRADFLTEIEGIACFRAVTNFSQTFRLVECDCNLTQLQQTGM